jgi:superfamily I DNA and/or RNA helicase
MQTFEQFKDDLLAYLHVESEMEKLDIEKRKSMSRDEKIQSNEMLTGLTVKAAQDLKYVLHAPENYSKLRPGDKVIINASINALVLDTLRDTITIEAKKPLDESTSYDMEATNPNLLESLIACLQGILPATPGAHFLRLLAGEENVQPEDFLKIEPEKIHGMASSFSLLNDEQKDAVSSMLKYFPIHVLQGPPGTGKTLVLANTAIASSLKNREVVIIANTHHAVNNALMKIRRLNNKVPLIKIGDLLKADELSDDIIKFEKFKDFNEFSRNNRRKKKNGYVIGMTIWGAITHLGLHTHSHFRPYMALVDEASLMPLSYASILGKCATSICFFGDSRQMPPIFRPELEQNVLSKSIIDYCVNNVKGVPVSVLPVTHRMNKDITSFVSKKFYEPHGIVLHSAEGAKERTFKSQYLHENGWDDSIVFMDCSISTDGCKEENEGEATAAIKMVKALLDEGKKPEDISVVTPFRKQVRLLRQLAHEFINDYEWPVIDTVERLQGQDVECIILTFAASDEKYIKEAHEFIFNPNRLNVMISRAKTKVIIFSSEIICNALTKKSLDFTA